MAQQRKKNDATRIGGYRKASQRADVAASNKTMTRTGGIPGISGGAIVSSRYSGLSRPKPSGSNNQASRTVLSDLQDRLFGRTSTSDNAAGRSLAAKTLKDTVRQMSANGIGGAYKANAERNAKIKALQDQQAAIAKRFADSGYTGSIKNNDEYTNLNVQMEKLQELNRVEEAAYNAAKGQAQQSADDLAYAQSGMAQTQSSVASEFDSGLPKKATSQNPVVPLSIPKPAPEVPGQVQLQEPQLGELSNKDQLRALQLKAQTKGLTEAETLQAGRLSDAVAEEEIAKASQMELDPVRQELDSYKQQLEDRFKKLESSISGSDSAPEGMTQEQFDKFRGQRDEAKLKTVQSNIEVSKAAEKQTTAMKNELAKMGITDSSDVAVKVADINQQAQQIMSSNITKYDDAMLSLKEAISNKNLADADAITQEMKALSQERRGFELKAAAQKADIMKQAKLSSDKTFELLMEGLGDRARQEINNDLSRVRGVMVDDYGNPVLDSDGNKVAFTEPKDTIVQNLGNGRIIVFDKNNPEGFKIIGAGTNMGSGATGLVNYTQSPTYRGENGAITSSPASNLDGSISITPEMEPQFYEQIGTYKDGGPITMANNCVKFARNFVPNLPKGLYTKEDKANAVANSGHKNPDIVKKGDAILTKEGDWGHAAVVDEVLPDGRFRLAESNYINGEVTYGRIIDPNVEDNQIIGYVPSSGNEDGGVFNEAQSTSVDGTGAQGPMSMIINDTPMGEEEGRQPGIMEQTEQSAELMQNGGEPTIEWTPTIERYFEATIDSERNGKDRFIPEEFIGNENEYNDLLRTWEKEGGTNRRVNQLSTLLQSMKNQYNQGYKSDVSTRTQAQDLVMELKQTNPETDWDSMLQQAMVPDVADPNMGLNDSMAWSTRYGKLDKKDPGVERFSGIVNVAPDFSRLDFELSSIAAADKVGPILGRIRNADFTDSDVQKFKGTINSMMTNIARGFMGEKGVLSDGDIQRVMTAIPNNIQSGDVSSYLADGLALTAAANAYRSLKSASGRTNTSSLQGDLSAMESNLGGITDLTTIYRDYPTFPLGAAIAASGMGWDRGTFDEAVSRHIDAGWDRDRAVSSVAQILIQSANVSESARQKLNQ